MYVTGGSGVKGNCWEQMCSALCSEKHGARQTIKREYCNNAMMQSRCHPKCYDINNALDKLIAVFNL